MRAVSRIFAPAPILARGGWLGVTSAPAVRFACPGVKIDDFSQVREGVASDVPDRFKEFKNGDSRFPWLIKSICMFEPSREEFEKILDVHANCETLERTGKYLIRAWNVVCAGRAAIVSNHSMERQSAVL